MPSLLPPYAKCRAAAEIKGSFCFSDKAFFSPINSTGVRKCVSEINSRKIMRPTGSLLTLAPLL